MTELERPSLHSAAKRKRYIKADDLSAASEMLAGVDLRGCELVGFTGGQFSLFSLLAAILEKTGPAAVDITTWTAAIADLRDAYLFLETGKIQKLRFLIDRSFESRQPQYVDSVRDLFPDSVRVTRCHAKFAVIRTEKFDLAIRTSMNLNCNRRFEIFEISDDPDLAGFLSGVVDAVWEQGQGFDASPQDVEDALQAVFT